MCAWTKKHRASSAGALPATKRLKLSVRGAVQGVGFRPFVFRLATDLRLKGWVNNSVQGVFIDLEGSASDLEKFLLRLETERPPRSFIHSLEASWLDAVGYDTFEIRPSVKGGAKTALVLPDLATCPDCLREILDPTNRRHFYPFTNCTNCGPRFSIIESLPYDRANTSMKQFTMCPECQREYDDPRDRRFHAQPNACPACGPHLEVWDKQGNALASEPTAGAIGAAAAAIRAGKIVAVKGLGGFHLMVAAHDEHAVHRLRELKHREEKPFAVMFPALEAVKAVCEVSPLEERLLRSPEAPIVLLRRLQAPVNRSRSPVVQPFLPGAIAPGNPNLGVMLPYTPLHHLLLSLLSFPVVATSGNLSDEPICTDEREARERLGGIADLFLVHNRPIIRHVDDSIVRVMAGRELVLRRARGYAPLPIRSSLGDDLRRLGSEIKNQKSKIKNQTEVSHPPTLALGAHLKSTIALAVGPQIFISQHIGDLETDQAYEAFRRVITDFKHLYDTEPAVIAADLHPDYISTRFAKQMALETPAPAVSKVQSSGFKVQGSKFKVQGSGFKAQDSEFKVRGSRFKVQGSKSQVPSPVPPRLVHVQHHLAHVLSCMAENELTPPALGVSWDGTGYGLDGAIWGGEFFLVTDTAAERVAHLRQFRLPGGDQAVKQPRRTALGLLYEMFGNSAFAQAQLASIRSFTPAELSPLKTMLGRGLNSPLTSSAGRLFDAVASLAGLRQQVRFEGQAAMELEFALDGHETNDAYAFQLTAATPSEPAHPSRITHHRSPANVLDWSPMIEALLGDLKRNLPLGQISARFHNALVEGIVLVARRAGQERVILSGGCFQNRYLTERAILRLQAEGFHPYWHQRVPPNDGGICLGQIVAAWRETATDKGAWALPHK